METAVQAGAFGDVDAEVDGVNTIAREIEQDIQMVGDNTDHRQEILFLPHLACGWYCHHPPPIFPYNYGINYI